MTLLVTINSLSFSILPIRSYEALFIHCRIKPSTLNTMRLSPPRHSHPLCALCLDISPSSSFLSFPCLGCHSVIFFFCQMLSSVLARYYTHFHFCVTANFTISVSLILCLFLCMASSLFAAKLVYITPPITHQQLLNNLLLNLIIFDIFQACKAMQ